MSTYENYDTSSKTYTGLRRALGWEKQLAHFQQNSIPVNQQSLIDTGCGTGNFILHYAKHFKVIHGCDFNEGMLDRATENMNEKKRSNNIIADVMFSKQDVTSMSSIPDNTFDALCNNQVLHHLPMGDDFASIRKATKEFYRILKPGGRGVINFSSPDQPPVAFWWAELIPEAMAKWLPRTPSTTKLLEILQAAGFENISFVPLYDGIQYDPDLYFNPKNFLDIENFRRSDSTFALCTDNEIKAAVTKMENLINSNAIDEWFKRKEEERKKVGQTTNVYFVKP